MSEVFLPPPPNTSILPIGYPNLVSYADAFDIDGLANNDSINLWPAPLLGLGRSLCTGTNEWKAPLVYSLPTYKTSGIGASIPGVAWALANPVSQMFQAQPFDQLHGTGGGAIFPNDYSLSSRPGITAVIVVKPTIANIASTLFTLAFPSSLTQLGVFGSGAGLWRGQARRVALDGSVNISAGAATNGTPAIIHLMADFKNRVFTIWQNGVQTATSGVAFSQGLSDPNYTGWVAIGGYGDGTDAPDAVIGYWSLWSSAYNKTRLAPLLKNTARRFGIAYTP
jgi:hypothetical protein